MLTHILTQDGKIITTEIDVYGDQKLTSTTSIKCRLREITEIDSQLNREGIDTAADAIVWTDNGDEVEEGTILEIESKYWRVSKLIKARRLGSNDVQFYKALVDKHIEVIEEGSS